MTTQIKKKKDTEIYFVIGMIVLFGGTLIGIDIWYADWAGMTDTWFHMGLFGAIVLHFCTIVSGYISLKEWQDYDFDVMRKWFCALAFASMLYIGGFRAAKNERQSVTDDSNQTKQEQLK